MSNVIKLPEVFIEHPDGSRTTAFRTTAERMHDSVLRHNLSWTDLAMRVADNEHIPQQEADAQVAHLIERKGCPLMVAVAIIDMIVDAGRSR